MTISSADLDRFYKANNVSGVCPACANNSWAIIDSAPNTSFMIHSQPTDGGFMVGGNQNIPLIMVACDRCFYIRSHAERPIQRWLEQHPRAAGK